VELSLKCSNTTCSKNIQTCFPLRVNIQGKVNYNLLRIAGIYTTAAQSDQKKNILANKTQFQFFLPRPGRGVLKKTHADGREAESHSHVVIRQL